MRWAAAGALLLIGGCNLADRRDDFSSTANNVAAPDGGGAANSVAANALASADNADNAQLAVAPPPRRDPNGLDREWFAGLWTDTGDCADAGQFARDGRYRLADGTRGMWNVREGRLVIENAGGRNVIRVRKIDGDTVETVNANGQSSRSTRCARVTPRAAPTLPTPEDAPKPAPPPAADEVD